MNNNVIQYSADMANKWTEFVCVVVALLLLTHFFTFLASHIVYAVQLFSKAEKPFGVSYDDWISKYWNWDVSLSTDQFTPKPGGCITNNASLVMVVDTTAEGSPHMACKISSNQGIMIPLWIGWCDTSEHPNYSDVQLTNCAREEYNLGNIISDVTVDGLPIAKLDVRLSLISGSVDYKINSLNNVTELYSKGFNLTIPPNTHEAGSKAGTWRAGSQGWWVFLKPLSPGQHTIYYNVRVTPAGALTSPGTSPHFADITYTLHVR
jgi:hypothetical protein